MAATLDLGVLGFSLTLDKKDWNKGWSETDGDISQQSNKLKSFASNVGNILKVGIGAAATAVGAALVGMVKSGIDNARELDNQMSKFRASTGMTGEEAEKVKGIVKDLYKVNEDSYEDLVKTAEALHNAMGMNADDIAKYAQNYLDYAKVTGQANEVAVGAIDDLGDAWGLSADEQVSAMDKILVMYQKHGAEVTDTQAALQRMAPAAQAAGYSLDESAAFLAMFAEAGVDSSTASTAFTKALQKVESPAELRKLIQDIENTSDPFARAQKATELFGVRAGPQMAQALGSGNASLEDFIEEMNGAAGAVTNASAAYDDNFNTRLALLQKKFGGIATEIGEKLLPIISNLLAWVEDHMPEIEATISGVFDAIGGAISWFSENVMPPLSNAMNAIFKIVQAVWPVIEGIIKGAIQVITGILSGLAAILTLDFGAVWDKFKNMCSDAWNAITGAISRAWENIKSGVSNAVSSVGNALSSGWESMKTSVTDAWNNITGTISGAWEGIKSAVSGAWENVKSATNDALSTLGSAISTGWEGIKSGAANAWSNITGAISGAWEGIKSAVSSAAGFVADVLSAYWNGIKNVVTTIWNAILGGIIQVWNGIKTVVTNMVEAVKNLITGNFEGLKTNIANIWNGIKTAITAPFEAAKNIVGGIIDTIKGWFAGLSFKLPEFQWPKIKLPHFSLKGDFSLSPLSVPKLSIDWYAKGAIFAKPTIFPTAQGLKGVGDVPGGEVVAPLSELREYIQTAMSDVLPTAGMLTLVIECDGLAIAKTQINYMDMLLGGQTNTRARGVISGI